MSAVLSQLPARSGLLAALLGGGLLLAPAAAAEPTDGGALPGAAAAPRDGGARPDGGEVKPIQPPPPLPPVRDPEGTDKAADKKTRGRKPQRAFVDVILESQNHSQHIARRYVQLLTSGRYDAPSAQSSPSAPPPRNWKIVIRPLNVSATNTRSRASVSASSLRNSISVGSARFCS